MHVFSLWRSQWEPTQTACSPHLFRDPSSSYYPITCTSNRWLLKVLRRCRKGGQLEGGMTSINHSTGWFWKLLPKTNTTTSKVQLFPDIPLPYRLTSWWSSREKVAIFEVMNWGSFHKIWDATIKDTYHYPMVVAWTVLPSSNDQEWAMTTRSSHVVIIVRTVVKK